MKIRKILAAVAGLALVCAMAVVPALAASDINANEQAIYDKWKNGVVIEGKTYAPVEQALGFVTNYFIQDDVNVTAEQKDAIIGYIDAAYKVAETAEAKALAKDSNTIDLSKLPQDQKATLLSNAQKAGEVIGLTVVYKAETNAIVITDAEGHEICNTAVVVKQTGESSAAALYIAVAALVAILGAAVVVAGKKVRA